MNQVEATVLLKYLPDNAIASFQYGKGQESMYQMKATFSLQYVKDKGYSLTQVCIRFRLQLIPIYIWSRKSHSMSG